MSEDQLEQAQRDAQREAAPFVGLTVAANALLAAASAWHNWRLYSESDWWVWLVLALPAVILTLVFLLGLGRLGVSGEHRRKAALILLGLLVVANLVGIGLVLGSLVTGRDVLTGAQLLASAAVVLFINMITFGLVFWELDSGGPVSRALAEGRDAPDFQFPQDENPQLARSRWAPSLNDYLYIALTNSIAFSPTDAMPLTRLAKRMMLAESAISAVTVLLVAARAVNIIG